MPKQDQIYNLFYELREALRSRKRAQRNFNRQTMRELKGEEVRVSPSFWLQAIRDCDYEIQLIEKRIENA